MINLLVNAPVWRYAFVTVPLQRHTHLHRLKAGAERHNLKLRPHNRLCVRYISLYIYIYETIIYI